MGAFLFASMSMFVSCKDYDDDINKNSSDIAALQSQISSLETALAQAKSEATAAHALYATKTEVAAKADPSDVAAVQKALNDAVSALSTEVKAMVTAQQLTDAIAAAQATLQAAIDGKADKADVEALALQIAAIDPQLNALKADLLAEIANASKAANDNIAAQQKAIEALQAALQAANDANASQETAIAALKAALDGEGDSETVKTLAADVAALKTAIAALPTQAAVDALDTKIKALEEANKSLAAIQTEVSSYSSAISEVKTAMAEATVIVDNAAATVNLLTVFVDKRLTSLVLRPDFYWGGIEAVECPALYQQYIYCAQNSGKAVIGDPTKSESWDRIKSTIKVGGGFPDSLYTYTPLAEATYHMNPTTANIAGANFDFFSNISAVRTRGNNDTRLAIPANDGVIAESDYANGFLTVKFTPNWDEITRLARTRYTNTGYAEFPWSDNTSKRDPWASLFIYDNQTGNVIDTLEVGSNYWTTFNTYAYLSDSAAMVSLKVSVADTAVYSDYARLAPVYYQNLALADKTLSAYNHSQGQYDLYKDVLTRINSNGFGDWSTGSYKYVSNVHPIVYDSKLNLSEIIQTHYTVYDMNWTSGAYHEIMPEAIMKKLNLHYEFAYIEYTKGGNKTDETQHIQLVTENDSIYAYPRNVDEAGKRVDDKVANKSAVGREPVIRVTLVDNEGRLYTWGYLKLRIVSEAPVIEDKSLAMSFKDDYYMNCDAEATLTWSQIEFNIYNNLLGISKAEFEAQYNFDGYYSGGFPVFNQYVLITDPDTKKSEYVRVDSKAYQPDEKLANYWPYKEIGQVREIQDATDPTTNVLDWWVYPVDGDFDYIMDKVAMDDNGISTKALPVTVRFNSTIGGAPIYVDLDIPATKLHFAVASVVGKTAAGWKQNNSEANPKKADESDFAELHYTVPTKAEHPANLANGDFQKDILESFKNKTVLFSGLDTHFSKFAGIGVSFKFVAPVKGVNATNFDAAADGTWKVNGVSGAVYTLAVSADGLAVQIVGSTDLACVADITAAGGALDVVTLTGTTIKLVNDATRRYAQDILNYVGILDQAGAAYANWCKAEDQMFTAFLQIVPDNVATCYPLMLKNNYFKVRFQRPINVYGKKVSITDALNAKQTIEITKLIDIKDWRSYLLDSSDADGSSPKIKRDFYGVATGATGTYFFDIDDLRTDYANVDRKELKATEVAKIEALDKVSDIPALRGSAIKYLTGDGRSKIEYTNKGDNVGTYYIYVPIYVVYTYGEVRPYTQKVYGTIEVKKTTGHEAARQF